MIAGAQRPKKARAKLKEARALASEGRRPEAAEILERLLATDPDWFEAVVLLGRIRRRLGDIDAADACARHAMALRPGDDKALLLSGRVALARGDREGARAIWDQIGPGTRERASAKVAWAKHLDATGAEPAERLDAWAAVADACPDRRADQVEGFAWPVHRPLRRKILLNPVESVSLPERSEEAGDEAILPLAEQLFRLADFRTLFALQLDLASRGSALADLLEARLLYAHQCFEEAIPVADRFLENVASTALPEPTRDEARFTAETVRARSLGTLKRAHQIRYTADLVEPKPLSALRRDLDIHWRQEPERGLAAATTLALADKPPVRATVLASYIPLVLGLGDEADHRLTAFLERDRALGRPLQPELALCGARIARETGDLDRFGRYLAYAYAHHELEPPSLDPVQGLRFETMDPDILAEDREGPLVTVIVTAFNAEATLEYSVRSLLRQSHRNLQIIVVDDCSSDGTLALAYALASRDPRIEVLANAANVGTYASKNAALKVARGRYFTIHDSDDWSHPRRIERHVELMESDPNLVASSSAWFRLDPSGRPQIRPTTGIFTHRNPGSAFVRLDAQRDVIGDYDAVRVDADNDHWLRLIVAFGPQRIARLAAPLAIGRSQEDSLTRSGVGAQDEELYSPIRSAYRLHGLEWRRRQANPEDLKLDAATPRRFPAPPDMVI